MKKLTLTFGVISSFLFFIGVLLKSQHYPGAGVAMTLGIAGFALAYAPLLFVEKNKVTQDKFQNFVNVMTLVSMIVIPIALLFKVQHWEGARFGVYLGNLMLLVMIVVLFMHGSKETDGVKKLNFYSEAILLVILTAFSFFIWLVLNHPAVNP